MDKQYNRAIQMSANEASLEGRKAVQDLLLAVDAGIVGVEAKVVENVFTPELKSGFELTFKNGRKLFAADDDWLFLMNGGVIAVSNNAVGRMLSDDKSEDEEAAASDRYQKELNRLYAELHKIALEDDRGGCYLRDLSEAAEALRNFIKSHSDGRI